MQLFCKQCNCCMWLVYAFTAELSKRKREYWFTFASVTLLCTIYLLLLIIWTRQTYRCQDFGVSLSVFLMNEGSQPPFVSDLLFLWCVCVGFGLLFIVYCYCFWFVVVYFCLRIGERKEASKQKRCTVEKRFEAAFSFCKDISANGIFQGYNLIHWLQFVHCIYLGICFFTLYRVRALFQFFSCFA